MLPLSGVKVVELGMWVAGPGAGGLLADWGADVVKIESPHGDPMRTLFAKLSGHDEPQSPPFDLDNRGKRSVVLDVRDADDRAALTDLIGEADVFLTNLRMEALDGMGLDPDTVLAGHDRLVYARVTGFGADGPDAHRPGYDVGAFWARSGVAASLLPEEEAPPMIRSGFGDHTTAMALTAGICAALYAREHTGAGQLVDTSLLRAGIYCMGWDIGIQLRFGRLMATRPRTSAANAMANSYRCADGKWFWALGIEADRHWPPMLAAIDRPDLADDERFATAKARYKNCEQLIEVLDDVFATRPRAEWTARFDEHDVWWAPVNTIADVVDDPQAHAAGAFVEIDGGDGAPGHVAVNTPVDFGGRVNQPNGTVPALGAHTDVGFG